MSKEISVTIVNIALACSSLIFGHVRTPDYREISFKDFAKNFLDTITHKEVGKYSWVICSSNINPKGYGDRDRGGKESKKIFEVYLKALGFQDTPRQHNTKNDSDVKLWYLPAPELQKRLEMARDGEITTDGVTVDDH